MLISNRHKFIFVHVPKTAGISIARALEPFCDNVERHGLRRLLSHLPLPELPENVAFRQHVTARWAKLKLPAEVFDGYRKFAVVRNPFDRAVSYYHFLCQRPDHHAFERVSRLSFKGYLDYLAQRSRIRLTTQLSFVADGQGRPLVDDILHFETLDEDFAALCRDLRVPCATALPKRNVSDHRPFWDYYADDYNRLRVLDVFADDFATFGYSTDLNAAAPPRRFELASAARFREHVQQMTPSRSS